MIYSAITLSVGSSLPGSMAGPSGVSTLHLSATTRAHDINTSTTRDSDNTLYKIGINGRRVLYRPIDALHFNLMRKSEGNVSESVSEGGRLTEMLRLLREVNNRHIPTGFCVSELNISNTALMGQRN